MVPWSVAVAAIAVFLTSLTFSIFGRGGGDLYLPIIISLLPLSYHSCAKISLFLIMLQGISMLMIYHGKHRLVDWGLAVLIGVVVGVSSFLGGFLSYQIPPTALKITFSIALLLSAYFIYRGVQAKPPIKRFGVLSRRVGRQEYYFNLAYAVPPIAFAAFMAGMVGISGGGLIIPVCIILGGVPIRVAMGTNTFLVLASSSMSFAGHMTRGGFDPLLGLIFGAAVIAGSQIGSRLHVKIGEKTLRKMFAIILVLAAIWMLAKIFI
ncbi:MAG: sulfite exporter TauE/SafE family protein [Thaumarchaeota archaeon]|nr:sulfite exporter TauE/SafE family protein [Nitrososphaerota archaeon]